MLSRNTGTQPSFHTHVEVLLGWVMCLGRRTEYGVFQTIQADTPASRKQRHPFDRFYNFFSRSAWTVHELARQVCVALVVQLNPRGLLYLVVDDTLLHKRGKHVYGLGWFRDPLGKFKDAYLFTTDLTAGPCWVTCANCFASWKTTYTSLFERRENLRKVRQGGEDRRSDAGWSETTLNRMRCA
jgi:hypothetical protein